MQDRLKFRGMTLGGEWVYGNLAIINKKIKSCGMTIEEGYYISNKVGMPFAYPVRPETIGQCTGLKDKNGKLIYEGDIIEDDNTKSDRGVVFFDKYSARFMVKMYKYNQKVLIKKNIRVVGNIHEENKDE